MSNFVESENSDDIAQLRQQLEETQKQLMTAQKLASVGELASSITHEFNNILTTVINYAKLGLRHQDDEARDKAFNKILSAGQRAAKITTGLLSYARNGTDRREIHSISQLVHDIIALVEKDLHVHRITLDLQITDEPFAEVNSGQLQQVLLNLLVNARQAMEPGGTLTVRASVNAESGTADGGHPEHGAVEISIQDTGKGIPQDVLPQIFERFFSTKDRDKQGQGGTGIGLALCKEVIESHKGLIRVESAVGHGTRFTLILPAAKKPSLMRSDVSKAG